MKKSTIASAVAAAIGLTAGTAAQAVAVTGITIRDVGSNTANAPGSYSATLDGRSGAFVFNSKYLNVLTYASASLWTGDVGTGTLLGGGVANPTGSFTTGFIFSGAPFTPYTFGGDFVADIMGGAMTVTTLDFGGNFGPGTNFNLPPAGAFPLQVLWTVATANPDDFNVAIRWGHDITTADDPSGNFTTFTAQWVIEGCASTVGNVGALCGAAVPVPAAVWLFGSGLLGLVGVARRRKGAKI